MDPHRQGRLGEPAEDMVSFTSSHQTDAWIAGDDLDVSRAHIIALLTSKLISNGEAAALLYALEKVEEMAPLHLEGHEDIHMAVEAAVTDIVGIKTAGKMHTGRSRNDQVATGIRMAARRDVLAIAVEISNFADVLLSRAGEHIESVMPGYTHMQRAQPVTLGFHLSAHAGAFLRDIHRMTAVFDVTNNCPLGSGALAGTGFNIDRELEASLLGFDGPIINSMDAVSTRDFAVQCLGSVVNLHDGLGRLASELVLWTTTEYNFAKLPDAWASTSSIMPQKKNPDVLELVRARGGTALGHFIAAATILRGLPYSYNRDLQQVTQHLREALCEVYECSKVMVNVVGSIEFNVNEMELRAAEGFTCATELADSLVKKTGISFREAHQIVGRMIRGVNEISKTPGLKELDGASLEVIGKKISELGFTKEKMKESLDAVGVVRARSNIGGTAPEAVNEGISTMAAELDLTRSELQRRRGSIETSRGELLKRCRAIIEKGKGK